VRLRFSTYFCEACFATVEEVRPHLMPTLLLLRQVGPAMVAAGPPGAGRMGLGSPEDARPSLGRFHGQNGFMQITQLLVEPQRERLPRFRRMMATLLALPGALTAMR